MSSEDALAAMKSRLAALESENSARMALLDKRREEALAESKEKFDKQAKIQGGVIVRLQERNRKAKAAGGWATESTLAEKVEDDGDFGFEEDEAENERRAGYRTAEEPPIAYRPPAPSAPPASPPPPAPVPEERPAGRHRRAAAARGDDDDFANTDWLAT
ncbi:hypothetical protein [Amycolatopsis regifaucium]|uniref:Uncharacterized protein n=1 Tax=Amycolatopsis regifaucium TaxID=546365 RepID=A0A154MBV3_9PSEU|nr:hypothetical protein [Amycolatopsis regifaucium]KZB82094.1 hypothetical protein AVL48_09100 [Amycolatopsis regifaucium]OKA05834.1 hypothetical protein ATP06_0221890 [Amycolatopsis regifaucium]SFG82378.1 hypothetical protein SAMN04489731_101601 [Amycolatopsis regifaucium]